MAFFGEGGINFQGDADRFLDKRVHPQFQSFKSFGQGSLDDIKQSPFTASENIGSRAVNFTQDLNPVSTRNLANAGILPKGLASFQDKIMQSPFQAIGKLKGLFGL